jgi:hypothetical protein
MSVGRRASEWVEWVGAVVGAAGSWDEVLREENQVEDDDVAEDPDVVEPEDGFEESEDSLLESLLKSSKNF